jgi:inosose dehydratase
MTFYERDGQEIDGHYDQAVDQVDQVGLAGLEPIFNRPEEVAPLAQLLSKRKLAMRSIYVNSSLHDASKADQSINEVIAIAMAAKRELSTEIVVTNPSPIRWGGNEDKSDAQLAVQAKALGRLGKALREAGMVLAYHTHDAELRQAAREVHHMLLATAPEDVALCLDAHWIYRGAGNSQVALMDIVKLYGDRIVELHLRQSKDQIWTEAFGEGDIDYPELVKKLQEKRLRPHLVLEQSIEQGTPKTMSVVEAHRLSLSVAKDWFADLMPPL